MKDDWRDRIVSPEQDQWKADTDLEMANHCMEINELRTALITLQKAHNILVQGCIIQNEAIQDMIRKDSE